MVRSHALYPTELRLHTGRRPGPLYVHQRGLYFKGGIIGQAGVAPKPLFLGQMGKSRFQQGYKGFFRYRPAI